MTTPEHQAEVRERAPERVWLQWHQKSSSFSGYWWTKGDVEYVRADLLQQPATSERCVCSHSRSQHEAYTDHDECLGCRGLDEPCCHFVAATGAGEGEQRWATVKSTCGFCGQKVKHVCTAFLKDSPPAPVAEEEPQTAASWATPNVIHEDQLPPDLSKDDYDIWYRLSWIQDGVRVGPRPPSTVTISEAAREIAYRWLKHALPDRARVQSSAPKQLEILALQVISKHLPDAGEVERLNQRIAELERRLRIPFGKLPCAHCGGPHDFDTSVPSVIWNSVIRAKQLPDYLCTTCIVREFVREGQGFTAELWNEEFNGVPIEVVVNGQNAKDAAAIQEENNSLRNQLSIARENLIDSPLYNEDGSYTLVAQNIADHARANAIRDALRDAGAILVANEGGAGARVEIRFCNLRDAQRLHKTLSQSRVALQSLLDKKEGEDGPRA